MSRPDSNRLLVWLCSVSLLASGVVLPLIAAAQPSDGLLGIYFDRDAQRCTGSVPSGSSTILYVVLVGDGATSSGLTGAEFRIETTDARSYVLHSETGFGNVQLGSALADGVNISFTGCQSARTVPVMSFQVLNPGSLVEATLRVVTHRRPSNPTFACMLAVLCDAPTYTKVCVEGGKVVLNPAAERPCGSSREIAEWTRIKELYKP